MSNIRVYVHRIQSDGNCQGRIITDWFTDIPAFPRFITDDAGNTYIRFCGDRDAEIWHCHQQAAPEWITLTFGHKKYDARYVGP
jgi:hypothetical protein